MTAKRLLGAFAGWREHGEPLVLASVYETAGSTYSKAGAQMLIAGNGDFQGMLSGGCLEGDLGERAGNVLQDGIPREVTYDLGQNDDELWGLGVGCDGLIRIFLQPLLPARHYQPFAAMAEALGGDDHQVAATVLQSNLADLPTGASLVTGAGGVAFSDITDTRVPGILAHAGAALDENRSRRQRCEFEDGTAEVLLTVLRPPPRVLVLGAGLDAEPVVRFVHELGWRATVQDHRPAYIENGNFDSAEELLCVPAAELERSVDLNNFDAAIVMSHHLVTDSVYLRALSGSNIVSIGLLGPPARKERIFDDLGSHAAALARRIHGPAGIDIGASGPAAIALSIVAQMHLDLATRSGPIG